MTGAFGQKLKRAYDQYNSYMSTPTRTKRRNTKQPARLRKWGPAGRRGQEPKFVDNTGSSLMSTTTVVHVVNTTLGGNDFYERIGNTIVMKSLVIRGHLRYDSTNLAANGGPDEAIIFLVYDRQCNGAIPTFSDVLQNTSAGGTTSSSTNSLLNPLNKDRFIILRRKQFLLPAKTASEAASVEYGEDVNFPFVWDVKLGGLEARFNAGNSATINDINTGSLLVITKTNLNTSAQSIWTCQWTSRLTFTD